MRAILESACDVYFRIDAAGTILDCKAGDTAGRFVSCPGLIGRKIHGFPSGDAAGGFRTALESAVESGHVLNFEYALLLHETEQFYEAKFIPLPDGQVMAAIRNVTDRTQTQNALKKSEEIYTRLVNAIPDAVMRINLDGKVLFVNDAAIRISGYSRDEIEGQNMLWFVALEDRNRVIQNVALMTEGRLGPQEFHLIMKDGREVLFELNGDVLRNENGDPFGFVTVCRDIAARKRAEDELQEARAELENRVAERTQDLTAANADLRELLQKQEVNIELAKNILAMINAPPRRHTLFENELDLFFTAYYLPCYAEGGDHFFVKTIAEKYPGGRKTVLSLKDQSGHEVSCILRSMITDLIHNALLVNTPDQSLEETISGLNREICSLPFFGEGNFFTAMTSEINHETLIMRYVSAGHPPFVLIRRREVVCLPLPDGPGRNLPAGILPTTDFKAGDIQLQKGDQLLFFTDGLTDMPYASRKTVLNAEDVKEMVSGIVREHPGLSVSSLVTRLFNRINGLDSDQEIQFHGFDDDITLIGVELEDGRHAYEDVVTPQSLDDFSACVNRVYGTIEIEWREKGFALPETRLRPALEEAMVNAWKHGNLKHPQKKITIRRRYGNDAVLEVIDEGKGFAFETLYDPTWKANLLKSSGRGLFIIRLLAEEVQWKEGGRHLITCFAKEGKKRQIKEMDSRYDLWRRPIQNNE